MFFLRLLLFLLVCNLPSSNFLCLVCFSWFYERVDFGMLPLPLPPPPPATTCTTPSKKRARKQTLDFNYVLLFAKCFLLNSFVDLHGIFEEKNESIHTASDRAQHRHLLVFSCTKLQPTGFRKWKKWYLFIDTKWYFVSVLNKLSMQWTTKWWKKGRNLIQIDDKP